jgi:alkylation response protein AidB-like acyl-CoA dehydrogenase
MAKAYATEAAQRIIDEGVQILGGRGVLAESVVDRLYRSIRALRIYEGTTEIQHLIVAGRILADARERGRGREDGGGDEGGGPAGGRAGGSGA